VRTAWGRDFRIGSHRSGRDAAESGARPQCGIHLRVRLARGLLGDHAHLPKPQGRGHDFAVGMALERTPQIAEAMAQSGFEVACHGQRWIDYQSVPEDEERAHMRRNIEVIYTPDRPSTAGLVHGPPGQTRAGSWSRARLLYDSDAYNDDLPFWTRMAGRAHLVVPYSFDNNDSRLQRGGDFATARSSFATTAMPSIGSIGRAGKAGPA